MKRKNELKNARHAWLGALVEEVAPTDKSSFYILVLVGKMKMYRKGQGE